MMKEKEMKRVPKLRFPEFTDDWEQRKVGKLVEDGIIDAPLDGNHGEKHPTADEYVDDGIPFLMASDIHNGIVDIVLCKHITPERAERLDKGFARNGDVLITHKATIGETAILQDLKTPYAVLTPQVTYYRIQNEEKLNRKYLYAYFNSREFQNDLKAKAAQSTRPYIGISAQQNLLVYLPSKLKEQEKIGEYFCNLDHLITLHQRKLEKLKELRKGVMKKLFNQEVRFKADDESEFPEWEKKKIGDVFSQIKDKNKDGRNQNVITNSAEFGLINQRDFFDKDIAVDGKTENYTVIKTGDFVYNPRKSKQAPYGPFNCYQLEENGIVSPLYTCLRPKSNVNDKYLLWYFKSGSWYRFIYENGAQNGARHDRVGMTDSLMQEIPVYLPQAVEEQQKIADCLSTLDDVIEKQKETLAAWEELKKGLLQQMFV